jgi:cold shock CspA family protein
METDLKIDLHGAEPSEAVSRLITGHVTELEGVYGRITACHVSVKAPGQHHRKGGLFEVSVHLSLPDGREVNVGRTPRLDERYANILFAVNDAFRRARRQLQDQVRRLQTQTKMHEAQPMGAVIQFDGDADFGFIQTDDGHEIYFHKHSILDGPPLRIDRGSRVTFVEEAGEKGPRASTVRLAGKHGLR